MLQENGGALVCMYELALMKEITVLSDQRNRPFALKLFFFKEQRKRWEPSDDTLLHVHFSHVQYKSNIKLNSSDCHTQMQLNTHSDVRVKQAVHLVGKDLCQACTDTEQSWESWVNNKRLLNCYLSLQFVACGNTIIVIISIILQLFNVQYVNTIIMEEIAVHYVQPGPELSPSTFGPLPI